MAEKIKLQSAIIRTLLNVYYSNEYINFLFIKIPSLWSIFKKEKVRGKIRDRFFSPVLQERA